VKVSLATTNRPAPGGKVVIGARTLPGNPFDGHTLAAQIAQTERITGVTIERAFVDRGYRGHAGRAKPTRAASSSPARSAVSRPPSAVRSGGAPASSR
jgi:IS5 family transposase